MTKKQKEIEEFIFRKLGKLAANVRIRVNKNDVVIFTNKSLIGKIIGSGGSRIKEIEREISGKFGESRIFVKDIKDIDKVETMRKSGNRSKSRTRPERKVDTVRIFFHPFKNKKSVPIQVQQAWKDYEDIIASLKPLAYDKVKRVSHNEFQIIERQDTEAIVYLDVNCNPRVVYPQFVHKSIPYAIGIKNKEIAKKKSYWFARLPIEQPESEFLVELEEEIVEEDILSREIRMVKEFCDLPDKTPDATSEEQKQYGNTFNKTITDTLIPVEALRSTNLLKEGQERYDFRDSMIYTIDGETTRDIDDAIQVEKIGEGHYILGIHIADVSEFVRDGSERDKDAQIRGTSHYLANTVIHMLPEILSQDYCSLKENQDRLAFSVFSEITIKGGKLDINNMRFVSSVIRSSAKLTYNNVEGFFRDQSLDSSSVIRLSSVLLNARELTGLLIKMHEDRSISFDNVNIKYFAERDGQINRKEEGVRESDKLIEAFMVTANELAGEKIANAIISTSSEPKGVGAYRVQAVPELEELEDFVERLRVNKLIENFDINGRHLQVKQKLESDDSLNQLSEYEKKAHALSLLYRQILESIQDKDSVETQRKLHILQYNEHRSGKILSTASLSDRYTASHHFSLGIGRYAWFTSPIRRYSDIINHRQLKAIINTGEPGRNDLDISELADKFKNAKSAELNLNNRLLLFYLCDQERLREQKEITTVVSFFRRVNTRVFVIRVVWKGKYEIPLYFENTEANVLNKGLRCELDRTGTTNREKLELKINDALRIQLTDRNSVRPDEGYIRIRDLNGLI